MENEVLNINDFYFNQNTIKIKPIEDNFQQLLDDAKIVVDIDHLDINRVYTIELRYRDENCDIDVEGKLAPIYNGKYIVEGHYISEYENDEDEYYTDKKKFVNIYEKHYIKLKSLSNNKVIDIINTADKYYSKKTTRSYCCLETLFYLGGCQIREIKFDEKYVNLYRDVYYYDVWEGYDILDIYILIKLDYEAIKTKFYSGYGKDLIEWIYHPKNHQKWGKDAWNLDDLTQ